MATPQEINAVVDMIVASFGGNPDLFGAFLTRARLNTELERIDSDLRKKQAEASTSASGYVQEIDALAAQRAAQIAEIDALES